MKESSTTVAKRRLRPSWPALGRRWFYDRALGEQLQRRGQSGWGRLLFDLVAIALIVWLVVYGLIGQYL